MATVYYKGLTGIRDSVTGVTFATTTIDQLVTLIAADEGLPTDYYKISLDGSPTVNDIVYGDSSTKLSSIGFTDGCTVICTTKQVGSKEERQIQKLEIAQLKRNGTPGDGSSLAAPYYRELNTYDRDSLPTKYVGNTIVDNANADGLVAGRPWVVTTNPDTAITVIETSSSGATLILNLDSRNTNSLPRTAAPGTWFDLTTNHNDATIYGGTIAYGQQGGQYCAVFPGGNANYAQAKSGVYFDGNSFTIQSWVYVTAVLNWNRIIDFGNGAGSNNILLSNTYGGSGKPGIYIEGTEFQSTYPGASTVLLNAWHQVCATFTRNTSGNTSQGIAKIYIDGQPYGSGTTSIPVNVTRNNCYIGKSNWGNPPDPNMTGGIGSLQIYNGALTDAEMLSNYNTTKSYYGL
jgi:hypothetical protein